MWPRSAPPALAGEPVLRLGRQSSVRLPFLANLQLRSIKRLTSDSVKRNPAFARLGCFPGRKNLEGHNHCGYQKNHGYAGPHQGGRALLILKRRDIKEPRRG